MLPAPALIVSRILTRLNVPPGSPQAVFYTAVIEEIFTAIAAADVVPQVPPVGFSVVVAGAPTPVTGLGRVV